MLLSVFFKIRPSFQNKTINPSQIHSNSPLILSSEFPREFSISLILVFFCLILLTLGVEITLILVTGLFGDNSSISWQSLPYLMAYFLANLLFIVHFSLYFGFHEKIQCNDDACQIRQNFFFLGQKITLKSEQIVYFQVRQTFFGNHYVEILYFTSEGRQKRKTIGSCLSDEHLVVLAKSLKKLVFYPGVEIQDIA